MPERFNRHDRPNKNRSILKIRILWRSTTQQFSHRHRTKYTPTGRLELGSWNGQIRVYRHLRCGFSRNVITHSLVALVAVSMSMVMEQLKTDNLGTQKHFLGQWTAVISRSACYVCYHKYHDITEQMIRRKITKLLMHDNPHWSTSIHTPAVFLSTLAVTPSVALNRRTMRIAGGLWQIFAQYSTRVMFTRNARSKIHVCVSV